MYTVKAIAVLLLVQCLIVVHGQSALDPYLNSTIPNNELYLAPTPSDPCNIGPSYWCLESSLLNVCNQVGQQEVRACAYSSRSCGDTLTYADFCGSPTVGPNDDTPITFNGGVTGSPTGYFGYYALALYWAPTSCDAQGPGDGGFCSEYTAAGNPADSNLVLHGLWPDYGSLYTEEPVSPDYEGSYQGWPQFCDGWEGNFSQCHVDGGLCPWTNVTSEDFGQSDYELCMRAEGITECLVSDETIQALNDRFITYAPGFADTADYSFLDHEFFKHGACVGGYLTLNKTAFFEVALQWTEEVTAPGTPAAETIAANKGGSITPEEFATAFQNQAIPTCTDECNLNEVWYCVGRDAAGLPTTLVTCPAGTLSSNSCTECPQINIPEYSVTSSSVST